MKLYNTMTNKIEEFKTIEENKVKMYVCGPTVYNYIHLGNARPIVVFDTLARYFKYKGMEVDYVQNFTDVDDKIINKSIEEGISASEVSEKYIKCFFEDINRLNILESVKRPKVTENMEEIIEIIQKLIDNGFAYEKDGDVYFEVKKYKDYGKLSNQKIEELELGARIDVSEIKKNPMDFALWKKKKDGEPFWVSPWGEGRPGWHIECSAMAKKYLGDTFDIHGGGQDLVFPHHENEIAQSKCAYHGNFANYWLHNGFIQINGDKMSKSTGNFFLLREILEKFSGNAVRLFILSTHYRKPINFSFENMEDTKKALQNIVKSMNKFEGIVEKYKNEKTADIKNLDFSQKIDEFDKKFEEAMDEDMNTPQALATIFDQIKKTNKFISTNEDEVSTIYYEIKKSYDSLKRKIENVFGIAIETENKQIKQNIIYITKKLKFDEDMMKRIVELKKESKTAKSKTSKELVESIKNFRIRIKLIELVEKLNTNKKLILKTKTNKELIELLIKLRSEARSEKNFKLSDEIRDELKGIGVEIKDNRDGTTDYDFM